MRLLHLEDNDKDAELISTILNGEGMHFELTRVHDKRAFIGALEKGPYDLILCDYNLPSFDGNAALEIARKKHPDSPFIFVSGTIGEERAIEALKNGATDYVLKHRMERLVPAVQRALRDVGERKARKQLEEQLIRAQRMDSVGALAGGIAHDLNNVLGPIMLGIEIIARSIQDPKSLRTLQIMAVSAKRGAAILKQVLGIARGDKDNKRVLPPSHVIDEVLNLIKETFPRSITIVSDIQRNVPAIEIDPSQLHQALLNLCVNARDAMPEYGELKITAEKIEVDDSFARQHAGARPGQYVAISVSDTGTGIPENIKDRIFDPFFTTKKPGKGTGLGLSSVMAIMKNHGGVLTVESRAGKGTTFGLYFPPAESEGRESTESRIEVPDGNGEVVLVVDDEASIREVSKELLESHGYSVLTASHGAEALSVYLREKDHVRVVVMDLVMPILDGPETIKSLKRINSEVKIIAVSGMAFEGESPVVAETDVVAVLHKPFSSDMLLHMAAKALGKLRP